MITLGTRTIYFTDQDGLDKPITIRFELLGTQKIDLGQDNLIEEETGVAHIESDLFDRQFHAEGSDHLHVIYLLMRLCDIYLQNLAFEDGSKVQISCLERGDVLEPFDVFDGMGGLGISDENRPEA